MNWPTPFTLTIDGAGDEVAVWVTRTGQLMAPRESRLTAAWVLHPAMVTRLRVWNPTTPVLATDRGMAYLPARYLDEACVVHGTQLIESLVSRIRVLNTAFDLERERRQVESSATASPVWPDLQQLGLPTESPARSEAPRGLAFRNALWLARVADAWAAVEEQRDSQPYLRQVALAS